MSEIQAIPGHPRGRLPFAPEGWPLIIPTLIQLPLSVGYELCVKLGDKVVAGKTIIARRAGAK